MVPNNRTIEVIVAGGFAVGFRPTERCLNLHKFITGSTTSSPTHFGHTVPVYVFLHSEIDLLDQYEHQTNHKLQECTSLCKICEENDDFCRIHVVLKFVIAHNFCNNTPNN